MRFLLCVCLLAGCERDLVAELPDAAVPVDASPYCAATPAQPLAAGKHKVFLNTEGVTLRTGCGDAAVLNCTTLIQTDMTVVPAFKPGVVGRDAFIAQLVALVQESLVPYSVDIVTTRPAAAPYQMVVLGGDPDAVTGGCSGCRSITNFSCDRIADAIDLVFDEGDAVTVITYASIILGDIATFNGLVATTLANDCMCRFDTPCVTSETELCTFGVDIPTTLATSMSLPYNCGIATENEPLALETALGCR